MFLVDIFYKQVGALLKFVLHMFAIQYIKLDGKLHIYVACAVDGQLMTTLCC